MNFRASLFLTLLTLLAFAGFAHAQSPQATRTYLMLAHTCTARGGVADIERSGQNILYPFVGDRQTRRYTACANGGGWNVSSEPGCFSFNVASYRVTCFGGTLSAPGLYAGYTQLMKNDGLVFQNNSLAVAVRSAVTVVPLDLNGGMQRALANATRLVPLPAGYAPIPESGFGSSFQSIAWDEGQDIPLMPVTAPPSVPADYGALSVASWVRWLSEPWVAVVLAVITILYTSIAMFGFERAQTGQVGLSALMAIALLTLFPLSDARNINVRAVAQANAGLATARAGLVRIAQDRVELRQITHANGTLTPLTTDAQDRIRVLTQTHIVMLPQPPQSFAEFWTAVYLAPLAVLLLLFSLRFYVGWHYLFVRHPADKIMSPVLRAQIVTPADTRAELRDALTPKPAEVVAPPPAYASWHMVERSKAFLARLRNDEALAKAAMERDIARAAQQQAQEHLRKLRQSLPWWKRWLWR